MEQQGGVKSLEPGVVSASRKQENNPNTNNTELDIFLNKIYEFKQKIWPLFLGTLKSQDQSVIDHYTKFLSHIYNIIYDPNESYNELINNDKINNDKMNNIIIPFINEMRNYIARNTTQTYTFKYYLKQNLLVCQFVYNFKAQKQCTENIKSN